MSTPSAVIVPFREPAGTLPGAAVLSFPALLDRAHGHKVDPYAPMRPAFHHLITVADGRLHISVDLAEHELAPGEWLWTRPHQALQFRSSLAQAQGVVILFSSGFLDDATAAVAHVDRVARHQQPVRSSSATHAVDLLADQYLRHGDLPAQTHIDVVRHLLAVVLLHIAHASESSSTALASATFLRFHDTVERDFARTRCVQDYARMLGYSERTLARACKEATGRSAKQVIDDRVVLEAKRLLVYTDLTSASIGARVGLPEPTAFTKFFRARIGETPTAFRTRARGV